MAILDADNWPGNNGVVGTQHQITIAKRDASYDEPFSYILRNVFANNNANLRNQTGPPLTPETHPRGSWKFSEGHAECDYIINQDGSTNGFFFRLMADDKISDDVIFTPDKSNPVDGQAVANPGYFGAIYSEVILRVFNNSGTPRMIRVFINPRGNPWFSGAVRSSSLIPPDNQNSRVRRVDILRTRSDDASEIGRVLVNPSPNPNTPAFVETISIATAGAAATPLALGVRPV